MSTITYRKVESKDYEPIRKLYDESFGTERPWISNTISPSIFSGEGIVAEDSGKLVGVGLYSSHPQNETISETARQIKTAFRLVQDPKSHEIYYTQVLQKRSRLYSDEKPASLVIYENAALRRVENDNGNGNHKSKKKNNNHNEGRSVFPGDSILNLLLVDSNYQRQGIGAALLTGQMEKIKNLGGCAILSGCFQSANLFSPKPMVPSQFPVLYQTAEVDPLYRSALNKLPALRLLKRHGFDPLNYQSPCFRNGNGQFTMARFLR